MPVDNQLYDTMADSWWDESGVLHFLRGINPARFGYMRRILIDELGIDPRGKRTLDVGCGGGLLAEEFARLGCAVTGVDPSEKSLAAARDHARLKGSRSTTARARASGCRSRTARSRSSTAATSSST